MKNEENKFNNYSMLNWLVQDGNISADIFFNFLDLFWPKFIEKDNYVFLNEKYSESVVNELIQQRSNPEYWIN